MFLREFLPALPGKADPTGQDRRHHKDRGKSHDNKVYTDGMAGAIYGQTPPLVNFARCHGSFR